MQRIAFNGRTLLPSRLTDLQLQSVPLLLGTALSRAMVKTASPQGTLPAVASHFCVVCCVLSREVYEYSFS